MTRAILKKQRAQWTSLEIVPIVCVCETRGGCGQSTCFSAKMRDLVQINDLLLSHGCQVYKMTVKEAQTVHQIMKKVLICELIIPSFK